MDKKEAQALLNEFLKELKHCSFKELKAYISNPVCISLQGKSGVEYQIEYESFWDATPDGDLRILASIDDGGFFSAMRPISTSFLITPRDEIIG